MQTIISLIRAAGCRSEFVFCRVYDQEENIKRQ